MRKSSTSGNRFRLSSVAGKAGALPSIPVMHTSVDHARIVRAIDILTKKGPMPFIEVHGRQVPPSPTTCAQLIAAKLGLGKSRNSSTNLAAQTGSIRMYLNKHPEARKKLGINY